MPSKLKKAIAAVKDQTSISLARVSNKDSSNLDVIVLKATSHENVPIDEKYVHEVLRLVAANKTNVSACARAIGKRIGRTRNGTVALKSLMLVLRIFQSGDPYFPREVIHAMKRGAKILNLSSFRDDSHSSPWDFTSFVRAFALYLDERMECFLTGKLQRKQVLEGDNDDESPLVYARSRSRVVRPNDPVGEMKPAVLLDRMSSWQRLLDRAIAMRPTGTAKTNRLVHVALYAILQEIFELYKDISEGLTLILDCFFHLQYQNCVIAYQTCIKSVKQFEELSSFFSLCKGLGLGRVSEYPSVQSISEEVIESLQEFLKDQASFQSNIKPVVNQVTAPAPPLIVRTRSSRNESYGGLSEFSVATDGGLSDHESPPGASIEDLIKNAVAFKGPAISIDLEDYTSKIHDDDDELSDTGSSRSLPVTSSVDLLAMDDWSTDDDDDEDGDGLQRRERRKGKMKAMVSKNWEVLLTETLVSSASLPAMPLTDNKTNTLCAISDDSFPAAETAPSTASNIWEIAAFDAAPPEDNPYNPFLVESPVAATFQAVPTFSAENPEVSAFEGDPFAVGAEFSGEEAAGDAAEQQNLVEQQKELWLQNQNKILEKNLS